MEYEDQEYQVYEYPQACEFQLEYEDQNQVYEFRWVYEVQKRVYVFQWVYEVQNRVYVFQWVYEILYPGKMVPEDYYPGVHSFLVKVQGCEYQYLRYLLALVVLSP